MGGLSPTVALAGIWTTAVVSGMVVNGATPLCFELAVEASFPVSTSFVIMLCTASFNAATLAMLFVPISSAASAFNWAYVSGCAVVTVTLWALFKEQSKRYDFDSAGVRPAAADPVDTIQ